jgi:hypothetical protein
MNSPFLVGSRQDAILMLSLERARLVSKKKPSRRDLRLIFALDVGIKAVRAEFEASAKAISFDTGEGREGGDE